MSFSLHILFYALGSFCAVMALVPLLCRLAVKMRLVDRPGGRKDHRGAVPLVGGLAVFSVFLPLAAMSSWQIAGFAGFAAALFFIVLLGAMDDRGSLRPRVKFAGQIAFAMLMVTAGKANIASLGNLFGFGELWLGPASIPFSIVAAVLLMNAINLADGLDGLAGGKVFIALFWMGLCCVLAGGAAYLPLIAILMAALAGFLFYNMRHPFREKAGVFLGDAGSLGLGLVLAWLAIKLADQPRVVIEPIAVAWVLALPIMDTCGQFARRVREGRHPFDADRDHFHHHFVAVGMSVRKATAFILAYSIALGAIGVGGIAVGIPSFVLTFLWGALLFTHIYFSMKPERMRTIIARLHKEKS